LSEVEHSSSPSLPRPLLDVQGVASWLVLSPKTVYAMVERGEGPPPIKVGRLLRWDRDSVQEWLRSQQNGQGVDR
jgi:excisionase family DNA binding protein